MVENIITKIPEKETEARCSSLQNTADKKYQSEMKSSRKWKSLASQVASRERHKTSAGAVGKVKGCEGRSKLSKRASQTKLEGNSLAPHFAEKPLFLETSKNTSYLQPLGRDTGKHRHRIERDSSNSKVRQPRMT